MVREPYESPGEGLMPEEASHPKVPVESAILAALMRDIFQGLQVSVQEGALVAEILLEASLAGYDSHGIMRIPMYAAGISSGTIVPGAGVEVLRETTASALLDARAGLGPVAAVAAVDLAIEKATESGVGCVSVVNCNDVARLGGYMVKPAEAGLMAIMSVNDAGHGPDVAPWGGVDPFLSTNPIAAGIPWRQQRAPVIIDVSTSVSSVGVLKMLWNQGKPAPEGWLVDEEGEPTVDADSFFDSPRRSALLPLGGQTAGHKGFALSLLVDVLAGALSGAGCSTGKVRDVDRNGVFVLVIDPEKFSSRSRFEGIVGEFLDGLKKSRHAPGVEEILIPGERAQRERERRLLEGIPVDAPTREKLDEILLELGFAEKYRSIW